MNKTKIEWADYTWNPVTGCLHNCNYCYARRIANRFKGWTDSEGNTHYDTILTTDNPIRELQEPLYIAPKERLGKWPKAPYPYGFIPTFHRYRLDEPQKVKKPSKIFVVSMGDLFGDWVLDEWIQEVFKACEAAPQHTYMFLTKNPKRYIELRDKSISPLKLNALYGATADSKAMLYKARDVFFELDNTVNDTFYSIEPLTEEVTDEMQYDYDKGQPFDWCHWVIIGAQTGPGAKPPKPDWVQSIINQCRAAGVAVFLKDNLKWPVKIQEWSE